MPRSLWKGAVSFGLVTIPVKLYSATEEKDVTFRQVHPKDGGRIKYKRVCEVCGEEVPYAEIAKGYESADGRMVILEASDFDDLPLPTAKQVEIVQFVELDEIEPTAFNKSYFLEAEGPGAKPYVLLREALRKAKKVAVVKVAQHEDFHDVIADRLNKVPGVTETTTHIAFRTYTGKDLEAGFDLGLAD